MTQTSMMIDASQVDQEGYFVKMFPQSIDDKGTTYSFVSNNTNPPDQVQSIKAEFSYDVNALATEIAKLRGIL